MNSNATCIPEMQKLSLILLLFASSPLGASIAVRQVTNVSEPSNSTNTLVSFTDQVKAWAYRWSLVPKNSLLTSIELSGNGTGTRAVLNYTLDASNCRPSTDFRDLLISTDTPFECPYPGPKCTRQANLRYNVIANSYYGFDVGDTSNSALSTSTVAFGEIGGFFPVPNISTLSVQQQYPISVYPDQYDYCKPALAQIRMSCIFAVTGLAQIYATLPSGEVVNENFCNSKRPREFLLNFFTPGQVTQIEAICSKKLERLSMYAGDNTFRSSITYTKVGCLDRNGK